MRVGVATDRIASNIVSALKARFDVEAFSLRRPSVDLPSFESLVVNADLRQSENIHNIRRIIGAAKNARKRLFVLDKKSHASVVQAYSLGATDTLAEPVNMNELLWKVDSSAFHAAEKAGSKSLSPQTLYSAAGHFASLFLAASNRTPISLRDAHAATDLVHDFVAENGLTSWLDHIRQHHAGTFQHCLLVSGLAIDFARSIGCTRHDVQRLGLMATLHDIGKAQIPVEILDKPGKLDDAEMQVMQSHPALGHEILANVEGVSAEVLDGVRHHHEYLDGSGYPDRLAGAEITDLVRMLTIADIFAALVENRSYKPPMPREAAYDILCGMTGQLEQPLVRAFRSAAIER